MIRLEVENRNNYEYTLKDENDKNYTLCLDFLDLEQKPDTGDYIYINEELLNPKYDGYSTSYTFGDLESQYGKPNISMDDIDVIRVLKDNMEIILKRLYG